MSKKKEAPKTFKPMVEPEPPGGIAPEEDAPALEVTKEAKPDLIAKLLKVEGMNQELAEHMAAHGIPGDSYVVQTFYRVSAITADAVIKVFQEVSK